MTTEADIEELKRRLAHAEAALRERTATEADRREAEETYRTMFDLVDEGFCVIEVLGGDGGEPLDYRFLEINASFERQTGLQQAVGRRMRELEPHHEEHWFQRYARIAETRTPERFEDRADALGRWYDVYAFPVGAAEQRRVGILFRDVIERKRDEEKLLKSNELLRTTFDSSLQIIQLFKAVRNEGGAIIDFEWLLTNKQWNDRWGPRAGQSLLKENPAVVSSGVWDKFLEVIETGNPITHEHFYRHEQFDGWFLQTIAKADDGILLSTLDITDRKRAEEAVQASEERYRVLFETMDEGVASVELIFDELGKVVDHIYLEHNAALGRQTGLTIDIIGKRSSELFPNLELHWNETYERVHKTGVSERHEYYVAALDRWFDVFISRVGDGTKCQAVSVYNDTTERKRTELAQRESAEHQAFLLRFSDALRAEPDADAIAYRAITQLSEQLGLDRCYITYYRPDEDEAVFPYQIGNETVTPLPPKVKLSDFPEAYAEVRERTFVMNDAFERRGLSESERANSKALGMRAMLASTLRKGHALPLASLAAVSSRPRQWSRAEIALVEETAERTWSAIERARADTEMRENEERLSLAIEIGALASWDWDVTSGVVTWNDRHFLMQGYGVGEVTPSFDAWVARVHPDDRDDTVALIEKARDGRLVYAHDFRSIHPDGRIVWCSARGRFFYGPDGQAIRMIGVMEDITERVEAEVALRESEARFRQFGQASRSALWVRDAETFAFEYVSPSVQQIYGVAPEQLMLDERLLGATVLPEERDEVSEKVRRVSLGETIVQEYRILRGSDQAFRWIRSTGFPIYDGGGVVRRIAAIAEDVTEAKIAVEHQGVLLAELQHRVRNIMAMIRSTAVRSADSAADVQDYKTSLAGRLLALARVQTLLTRQANAGGSLRDILESEIEAQAHSEHQYELTGPDIMLSPKAVEVLTLAFHELSTNALKYGALSIEGGKVSVSWAPFEKREKPWLAIEWVEEGAPPRPPPTRRGFGSELIEAKIPYELRGTGTTTIEPGGARCHIEFPIREAESILETDAPTQTRIYGGSVDMTGASDLNGKTVMVVEDDYYVASDTAAALRGAGAKVLGPCPTEEDALHLLEEETPTAVVLDLNLGGGGPRFEIAHKLVKQGTPFVFLTGYDPDVIPDELTDVVRLQKPIALRDVVEAVSKL